MTIGNNTTTGNIQIGYPSTFTGNIGIGTLMGGGSIDIGSYPTGNNQIVIGDATKSTTYLRGRTLYIADGGTTVNIGNTGSITNVTGKVIIGGAEYSSTVYQLNVKSTASYNQGTALLAYYDDYWVLISCNSANAFRGGIRGVNSTTIAYDTSSDRRLKTNIKPMKPMMDKIMSLKPSEHGWISNEDIGYGFIAQEVFEVFPEMRHRNNCYSSNLDEPIDCNTGQPLYYGLDYGKFTPYIVKAVQEIKLDYEEKFKEMKTNHQLIETKYVSLQSKYEALLSRIVALESKGSA
jgi:hypothetical protein